MGILQFSVDSISTQQQVTANNIANDETPGYTAQTATFAQSLQQAMQSPTGGTATLTVAKSTAPAGSNGNNVDLATEMTNATEETMEYQSAVQLLNTQFHMLDGVAGGSFS